MRSQQDKKGKLSEVSDDVSVEDMNLEDLADEDLYFSPEKGNVLFASAFDGWAFGYFLQFQIFISILFRLHHFSDLYVKKLGVKKEILEKTLWGDFYFHMKNKKVYPKNIGGKMSPMFVQFVLNNIWDVYNTM
jgi:ribosome assembly protein 1